MKNREVSQGSLKIYRLLLVAAMAQVGLKAFHMKYPGKYKGTQTCNVNVFFLMPAISRLKVKGLILSNI